MHRNFLTRPLVFGGDEFGDAQRRPFAERNSAENVETDCECARPSDVLVAGAVESITAAANVA